MAPEEVEALVDRFAAAKPAEPAIGIGGQRIGMHDQRARRASLPVGNDIGGAPGRGGFDEIGALGIEPGMNGGRIVEIAVAPIDNQRRACDVDDPASAGSPLDMIVRARRDDDDLMAQSRTDREFAVDIGFHTAAVRRIKGTDIDNLHLRSRGRYLRPLR